MFALLATLFSAASLAAAQGTCARSYVVQEGDYCDKISAAQNSSTYQIAVSNYQVINDGCTNLVPDQTICLGITNQDCKNTYIVQEGDYCDLISGNFGINSTLLMINNPQIDELCYNLYVGEVLCVATDVLVTPAPAGWTLPGSNLDDGSFEETGSTDDSSADAVAVITTTAAATTVQTTAAAATTSPVNLNKGVQNNVADSSTADDDEDCDDSADEDDDSAEDDDVPDCDD